MHTHGIEVFNGADDDAIVFRIAYYLHFEFFPADDRFLDQQFPRRRSFQPALADIQKFLAIVCDTAAATTHGK